MKDAIRIYTNDYEYAMSIANWCKQTFTGIDNGEWLLYMVPSWAKSGKAYELVITPKTEQVEMLVKLRWL